MMQPRRADVGAAMIARGAEHPGLQISKGHIVGKAAGVDLSVVMAVRIAAVDEHAGSPEASHIRERHGLVVQQKVRDRPGHDASKRGIGWRATASGYCRSRDGILVRWPEETCWLRFGNVFSVARL
jgi:hypothetical protein